MDKLTLKRIYTFPHHPPVYILMNGPTSAETYIYVYRDKNIIVDDGIQE